MEPPAGRSECLLLEIQVLDSGTLLLLSSYNLMFSTFSFSN